MPKIIVEIMPKPVLLDPQGKAVTRVLERLGTEGIQEVRIGKRFEVEVEGPVTDERLAEIRKIAEDVFSNPVIEDVVSVTVSEPVPAS